MSFAAAKYRKKPVVIEAIEFAGYTTALAPYPPLPEGGEVWQWLTKHGCDFVMLQKDPGPAYLEIHTLEGTMRADVGDYIIKGVAGEFYPCKPAIFKATYEAADTASKPYIMTIQIPPLPPQIVHTPECEHGLPKLVCPKCAPSAEEIENAPVEDHTNE